MSFGEETVGGTNLPPTVISTETYGYTDSSWKDLLTSFKGTTTPNHPFYVPAKGWIDAVKLRAGDMLVLLNGEYVVDGHHRLAAAKRLNMNCVPATEVSLPYAGYKTIDDLLW